MTTTHTVRITCACQTCTTNAARLGKTAPLVAWVTPQAVANLGGKVSKSAAHGLVHLAHDPHVGAYQTAALAG